MRKALCLVIVMGLGWGVAPHQAAAQEGNLFGLWASGLVGGATGRGQTGRDFYEWAGGGAAGFEAGLHLLFITAYVEYLRFFGGDEGANLWSVNLGGDNEWRFGKERQWGLVLRLAGTYYFGSLNNGERVIDGVVYDSDWVDDNGIGIRGGLGPRYHFAKIFSVGITPQIGYHYFFHGADGEPPPGQKTSSHGWDFQALAYLRVGWGI